MNNPPSWTVGPVRLRTISPASFPQLHTHVATQSYWTGQRTLPSNQPPSSDAETAVNQKHGCEEFLGDQRPKRNHSVSNPKS